VTTELTPEAVAAVVEHGEDAMKVAARYASWRAGDLSFLRHDIQQRAVEAFWSCEADRSVWKWARRLGKSWGCVTVAFEMCLSADRRRVPYAAATALSLKEFIIPIATAIAETAPPELRPEVMEAEVRFKNGSRIVFCGCEDRAKAERLRGPESHLAIVDEAGFIPILDYVVRSILLPQLLTTDGRMLLASTPPETAAHPFEGFAKEAEERGAYSHHNIYDAPHITDRQRERFCIEAGGEHSTAWRREGLALSITDPDKAIVPEFEANEAFIVGECDRPELFDAYVIGDVGFTDLTVILFGYWHFEHAKIVIERELVLERATTAIVQKESDELERALWPGRRPRRRLVDTSQRTAADMASLQDAGDPTKENRWMTVVNADREAAVNQLRMDVDRHRILISPKCRVLIAHLRHGIWNTNRTDFARIAQHTTEHTGGVRFAHFDAVAAAMYFVRHVQRNRMPKQEPKFDEGAQNVPKELKERLKAKGWGGLIRRKHIS
jgi:hypothetical protein